MAAALDDGCGRMYRGHFMPALPLLQLSAHYRQRRKALANARTLQMVIPGEHNHSLRTDERRCYFAHFRNGAPSVSRIARLVNSPSPMGYCSERDARAAAWISATILGGFMQQSLPHASPWTALRGNGFSSGRNSLGDLSILAT